ncbi:ABC transporter substrate-binding protein [Egibacter rhizosphaerae]|uniref:ABC transporter substrate-binding protein n=1 Tax=Egibacter rhizosphaerae TaxID=1670831 RepID=A0A411YHV0_9ACTN|nr:ABC transporter substrate-binding protein [Egibacter rhizosphaerae]QBI20844.1 ABC transporter substrate-binding protein [Egibacter rhizosphaerae]
MFNRDTRDRRVRLGALGVLALVMLLAAACAPGDPDEVDDVEDDPQAQEEAGDSEEAQDQDAESTEGSTLTIAIPDDIATLNPPDATSPRSNIALVQLYDSPFTYEHVELDDGTVIGDSTALEGLIFEEWETEDDGQTYTITIREDAAFHDGEPITAEHVHYMFERSFETQDGESGSNWYLTNVSGITEPPEVIDEHTIELSVEQPSQLTMRSLTAIQMGILDSQEIEENAPEDDPWANAWLSDNVAGGSGPYELVEWERDQRVVFEANADYWRGAPDIDRIVWEIVPSASERVQLLQAGEVDMVEGLGPDEIAAVEGADGVDIVSVPSQNRLFLGMNNTVAPYDDQAFRQAVSHAVDYDELIQEVYGGDAERLHGPYPEGPAGSPHSLGDEIGYETDLAEAERLLEESGYDGSPVTLSIDNSVAEHEEVAVRVQSFLAAIDVDVEIDQMTPSVFAEQRNETTLEFFVDESLSWIDDPAYFLSVNFQCGVLINHVEYCNEDIDAAIEEGWTEMDEDVRQEMFGEAQRTIVDEAPWVFIAHPDFQLAMRDHVEGYVHYIDELPRYYDLSLSDDD